MMRKTATYPHVRSVRPLTGKRLRVTFANGVAKIYDCTPLLKEDAFKPLEDEALFRSIHVEAHGYAVVWTDEIDLAESELWLHGKPTA